MGSSSATLRVGIVGFGQWGPNHARILRSLEGCDVVRICDHDPVRRETAQRQFRGVEVTANPADVVAAGDIDAVVIATPVSSHVPLAEQALLAGKHVLCEKPLAATARECRLLRDLAVSRQLTLMVGHVFLYNPGVRQLKADLDRGELGRPYYLAATRTNLGPVRHDVGAIADLASHDISIFNHLLGSTPSEVSATGGSFLRQGIEDVAFLTLHYPPGIVCHAHVSWLNPRKVRQVTVVGDRRMAVWDDMNLQEPIRYHDKGVTAGDYSSFGEFQLILRDGAITIPKLRLFEPLACQDQEFVDCIRSGRRPTADAEFGLGVVRVVEAAATSLAQGGRMTTVAPA